MGFTRWRNSVAFLALILATAGRWQSHHQRVLGVLDMRALVVDDSRSLRNVMGDMLRDIGFEVTTAADGAEALATLHTSGLPDVALVDWNMPVMDGLAFVQAVRRDSTVRRLPVMMVTTEIEMDQMVRALAAGANEYVMKPFTKDVIAEKLTLIGVL